ncbi:MAG: hypothetical protein Q9167_004314 [Letrouitia subvulpina]
MADDNNEPYFQQPANAPLSALSQQPPAEPTVPQSSTIPSQSLPQLSSPQTISSDTPSSPLYASSQFDEEEQPQTPKPEDSRAMEPNSFPLEPIQTNEPALNEDSPTAPPNDQENEEPWDPRQEIDPFDWTDLESRFRVQMDACTKEEEAVGREWKQWAKIRERELQEKQQHYKRVLQAFESALALLGASPC